MQQLRRPEDESGWQIFGSARPIAWKTGTSYGFRDAWALGLNNRYVVAVWLGNADGEGRAGLTGILAASPLMFDLFELLPGDAAFDEPFGSPVQICTQSGRHASPWCPQVSAINLPDYLREGALCENHPLLHLDAESQYQVNSSCYPVDKMLIKSWFVLPPVQAWYYRKYHTSYIEPPPFLPGCGDENAALSLALIYPRQFTRVFIPLEQDGQPGRVVFEAAHQQAQAVIFWHLDEQYLGQTTAPHQMAVSAVKGRHTITLVDDKGAELHQVFEVINTVK
jgi:penicillin-binding protein 1C